MNAMAVDAGWHVWIGLVEQCRAMHAAFVLIEDGAVTFAAGLWNSRARIIRIGHIVSGVTIGAHGARPIARG